MAGKTVLVTGASGGIGKATALGLAALGARVAITGRDRDRAEDAAREIRTVGDGQVDVFIADLSSQAEVRRLAEEVLECLPRIDVLVNNVGGYWNSRHLTADDLERTFALNHLAPFLLTNLLLDRLQHSAPARVVTVSSNAQALGRITFDDLQGEQSYSGSRAYNQSKLANVMFTYELARTDYPADFDVDYPEHLSHGLVLIKSWLLAVPHLIIIGLFTTNVPFWWNTANDMSTAYQSAAGISLLGILVLVAGIVLLVTRKYPPALFDLTMGLNRWIYRVITYVALMRDEYPPFRLDQGGHEPVGPVADGPIATPDPLGTPA